MAYLTSNYAGRNTFVQCRSLHSANFSVDAFPLMRPECLVLYVVKLFYKRYLFANLSKYSSWNNEHLFIERVYIRSEQPATNFILLPWVNLCIMIFIGKNDLNRKYTLTEKYWIFSSESSGHCDVTYRTVSIEKVHYYSSTIIYGPMYNITLLIVFVT